MNYIDLIREANRAKDLAYAPYSNFRVGAAILSGDGRIFKGANIENASYGLTMCAERTAVFAALLSGAGDFSAIAIASDLTELLPPCGACRQVLSEHCGGNLDVILTNDTEEYKVYKLSDLLPLAFNDSFLK